ncbi:MAG: HAD-IA family hydrolase [Bacteriovoracaceae bacterium]|nr:HAD-IA family hydrolase [Bacteriovoracaceae bacterium]
MLKGIIFDLDNTIITSNLDFAQIKCDLGIARTDDIIEHLRSVKGEERINKEYIVHRHETRSVEVCELFPDFKKLLEKCKSAKMKTGILTRNSRPCTEYALAKHQIAFDHVLTREDLTMQKPHPEGLLTICQTWQVTKDEVIWVGDSQMDVQTGNNAGIKTYYFDHQGKSLENLRYISFKNYAELVQLIEL